LNIVIDTSALIAVIVGEPERGRMIEATSRKTLLGPGAIPWEIGNAFSAMFKRNRLTLDAALEGLSIFSSIPIRYVEPEFVEVLKISEKADIYAYDAYFLECALRYKAPLLTLDRRLKSVAEDFNIEIVEV
jgi:predicted nucleic acid-binding protein